MYWWYTYYWQHEWLSRVPGKLKWWQSLAFCGHWYPPRNKYQQIETRILLYSQKPENKKYTVIYKITTKIVMMLKSCNIDVFVILCDTIICRDTTVACSMLQFCITIKKIMLCPI